MVRIGGQVKPNQMWSVIQRLDMRVGTILEAKLPAEVNKKYKGISAPVYIVRSNFGSIADWPYTEDGAMPSSLVTAAKIKTYHTAENLNSGSVTMVGLLNAGIKQVGRLQTYYLLTGAYTDELQDQHNVARTVPLASVEIGARMTVLSLRQDGSVLAPPLPSGGALLETMDFEKDFLQNVDVRVGYITAVHVCPVCDGTLMLLKDPCPLCQDPITVKSTTPQMNDQFKDNAAITSAPAMGGCMMIGADFGFGEKWTQAPLNLRSVTPDLVGKPLVAMANLEPFDDNEFLLLGFYRASDGLPIPLSIDCPSPQLPPPGAHLV